MASAAVAMKSRSEAQAATTRAPRHLQVVRFGQTEALDVTNADVVTFEQGLVGMEHLRQFAVVADGRLAPCAWLQSIEEPALAFVVIAPTLLLPEYAAEISGDDAYQLELEDPDDADIWSIVTIVGDPRNSTVNLLAPVIVNRKRGLGKQVILSDARYSLRHPLISSAS
jgi:flagellar assembly factor FliW